MKSVKYYALALMLVLGLIGGAYAAWSDTLEVEGTVDTGEVDVIIKDGVYLHLDTPDYVTGTKNVVEDGKKAEYTISNLYPQEAGENYRMPHVIRISPAMLNEGSIPVKLESAEISTCGHEAWDYMRAHLDVGRAFEGSSTRWGPGDRLGLPGSDDYGLTRYHGVPFKNLDHYIEKAAEDQDLEPGEMVRFSHPKDDTDSENSIYFWLDADSMEEDGKENKFQNLEDLTFTISFDWQQWNK